MTVSCRARHRPKSSELHLFIPPSTKHSRQTGLFTVPKVLPLPRCFERVPLVTNWSQKTVPQGEVWHLDQAVATEAVRRSKRVGSGEGTAPLIGSW